MAVRGAGVILSRDKGSLRDLKVKKNTLDSLPQDVFLLSPDDPSKLVNFTCEWVMVNKVRTQKFTLELIDPDNTFEKLFFDMEIRFDNVLRNKFKNVDINSKLGSWKKKAIDKQQRIVQSTPIKRPSWRPSWTQVLDSAVNQGSFTKLWQKMHFIDPPAKASPLGFVEKQKAYKRIDDLNERIKGGRELQAMALAEVEKNFFDPALFYIAFGHGTNFDTWAGPYVTKLVKADMNVTGDGIRTINLEFVSDMGVLASTTFNDMNLDIQGYGTFITATSVPRPATTLNGGDDSGVDYHALITEAIGDYIKQVSNTKTVMVLLPDINKVYKDRIEKGRNQAKTDIENSRAAQNRATTSRAKLEAQRDSAHQNALGVGTKFGADIQVDAVEERGSGELEAFIEQAGIRMVESVLKQFGMTLKLEGGGNNITYSAVITKPISTSMEYKHMITPGAKGRNAPTNYFSPLQDLIDIMGIPGTILGYENDQAIIDIWERHILWKQSTLGYQGGPVAIFGDEKLIRHLIYSPGMESGGVADAQFNLHPIDSQFDDEEMRREIRDLKGTIILDTELANFYGVPDRLKEHDEFSVEYSTMEEDSRKFNIPIFRVNVENPNVLELDFTLDDSYLQALGDLSFYNVGKQMSFMSNEDLAALAPLFDPTKNKVKDIIALFSGDAADEKKLTKVLKGFKKNLSKEEWEALILALTTLSFNSPKGPQVTVSQATKEDAAVFQQNILDRALREATVVTIKTLPFFKLSSQYYLGKPAFLIGTQPSVVGRKFVNGILEKQNEQVNSFYSDSYIIMGFEHEISEDEISSTFTLLKTGGNITTTDARIGGPQLSQEEWDEETKLIKKLGLIDTRGKPLPVLEVPAMPPPLDNDSLYRKKKEYEKGNKEIRQGSRSDMYGRVDIAPDKYGPPPPPT